MTETNVVGLEKYSTPYAADSLIYLCDEILDYISIDFKSAWHTKFKLLYYY
jgi:hypothetical protein